MWGFGLIQQKIQEMYEGLAMYWRKNNKTADETEWSWRKHLSIPYAPTEDGSITKKENFYKLCLITVYINNRKDLTIFRDLNARADSKNTSPTKQPYWVKRINRNGDRLIEYFQQNEVLLVNGFSQHPNVHRYTWTQPKNDSSISSFKMWE